MKVVMPARGEFGLRLRYHVPAVHALEGPKIVYHEPGCEALYPSANRLIQVPAVPDDLRRGTHPKGDREAMVALRAEIAAKWPDAEIVTTRPGMPEARFVPTPHTHYRLGPVDVVICPRWRRYGASKNWPHWRALLWALERGALRTFAAGAPDSSVDLTCPKAWGYARFLDVSIQAMLAARLVIATDAGLAHLAVLCGAPLLMITDEGRVAPGPVLDSPDGKELKPAYWPVRLDEYYRAANHTGSLIETFDDWNDVDGLAKRAGEIIDELGAPGGRP